MYFCAVCHHAHLISLCCIIKDVQRNHVRTKCNRNMDKKRTITSLPHILVIQLGEFILENNEIVHEIAQKIIIQGKIHGLLAVTYIDSGHL